MSERVTPVTGNNGTPRKALVVGGNSGVGLEVARGLGQKGYKVWIAARRADKGAEAVAELRPHCPAGIEFLSLDLMESARIQQFLRTLKPQLDGRLDALVLSSGANSSSRVVSADGWEMGWATQFLGRYLLTEALTPELSRSDDGRVVFVGALAPDKPEIFEDDLAVSQNYTIMRSISQAQSAQRLYEQLYAVEHPNGPAINGGSTGSVRGTDIFRELTGFDKTLMTVVTALMGISAEKAAQNFIALAADPAFKGVSGHFFPDPKSAKKRTKLEYTKDQLDSLRRVLAKYADLRSTLLSV